MDNTEMLLYSRFSLAVRRAGLPLDLMRFASDDEYAKQILARALQSSDQELLRIALQISDRRRLLNQVPAPSAPPSANAPPRAAAKPKTSKSDDANDDDDDPPPRYVRSLR